MCQPVDHFLARDATEILSAMRSNQMEIDHQRIVHRVLDSKLFKK